MPTYPLPFDYASFKPVPAAKTPAKTSQAPMNAKAGTDMGGTLKLPAQAKVDALWIESIDSATRSASFRNHSNEQYAPVPVDDPHFNFLPGIDPVVIRWTLSNYSCVSKLCFELWCATDKGGPIWRMEKSGDEAAALLRGSDGDGTGPLPWSAISVTVVNEKFPDGCCNAANAPYQLRLTVTCGNSAAVTTAWTYFDILVDSIELHWGPEAWIPNTPISGVSTILKPRTTPDEKKVLERLKGKLRPTDPEVTAIDPAGPDIKVLLPSTMAAYITYGEWFGWYKDFPFLRHRARWGEGPRIPLQATIFLKRMDGSRLDPGSGGALTWNQAGAALGPTRLLWDWRDRPLLDRTNDENRRNTDAGDYVLRALGYRMDPGDEPPGCRNCHVNRGGKRGGPDRIFPAQTGGGSLPFAVAACSDRKWAALSTASTQGPNACQTGVIFNPSRMAKDSYQVTVLLANQLTNDLSKPAVDATGSIATLLSPGLPSAKTPMMEITRLIHARYLRKGNYAPIDLDLIDQVYEVAGLQIEWLNNVDHTFTGFWEKANYEECMKDALACGGTDFSDKEELGHRYSGAFPETIKEKRYTHIGNLSNRKILGDYDHWYGCPNKQTLGGPSDTCFTLPSKDAVLAACKDQAIRDYIGKARRINDKLKRWRRLVAANPGAAEPALRLQFYNSLTPGEKLKVEDGLSDLYRRRGWTADDENDANEWARKNYDHTSTVELLAEMHQLKIFRDDYFGVTFFHYINILQTVDAAGNTLPASGVGDPTGRYYALGGVAKCDTSTDLGLKSCFFTWDHPNDGRRKRGQGTVLPMMDGNSTSAHEFGHNFHLPHPFSEPWNRDCHDGGPALRASTAQEPGPTRQCLMNYHHQDLELCGVCRLRLRGWGFMKAGAIRGFESTDPDNDGLAPRAMKPLLNTFFTDLN